jgi:hypothetical protein
MVVEVEVVLTLVRHHKMMVLVEMAVVVLEMVVLQEMQLLELQIQAVVEVELVKQTQLYHQVKEEVV